MSEQNFFPIDNLILVSGKAGSGKDYVSDFIIQYFDSLKFDKIRLSHKIKDLAAKEFAWNGDKDERGRQLLIDLGRTGYNYHPAFWASTVIQKAIDLKSNNIIVPDFRFLHELIFFNHLHWTNHITNLITIRVERPSLKKKWWAFWKKISPFHHNSKDKSETELDCKPFIFDIEYTNHEDKDHRQRLCLVLEKLINETSFNKHDIWKHRKQMSNDFSKKFNYKYESPRFYRV